MSPRKHTVILTQEAREDFLDLTMYSEVTWGTEAAESYHAEIASVIDDLAMFPRLGRRKAGVRGEIRVINVAHHVIYYRIDRDIIRILRILHGRMNATHHLDL